MDSIPKPPIVFLDLDDVLCLNNPYGGYDVFIKPHPSDLWKRLFSEQAVGVLHGVLHDHGARVVLTTSWLMLLDREGFEQLFRATGLALLADGLHEQWDAPTNKGGSRLQAIERWLEAHHRGVSYVVIDDHLSGTGLAGSAIDQAGRLVMCEVGVGLQARHTEVIRQALRSELC